MATNYDVIIAGAGPVGLLLACELALAHISVVVLERDVNPVTPQKSVPLGRRGLNNSTLESLYRRGLKDDFLSAGNVSAASVQKRTGFRPAGIFAGIMMDSGKLELNRWKYRFDSNTQSMNMGVVDHMEGVLAKRAEELGATILRGKPVTKIVQEDEKSITVESEDGQTFQAKWLVGCDGGRSAVRKLAGVDFFGTDAKFTGYGLHCDLDQPELLKPGFHVTDGGMYIKTFDSLYVVDFDDAAFDRTQEVTKDHAQDVLARVTGFPDLKITALHGSTTCTDRARQAATYRKGRILLAGDAGHIHGPVGGQGLNVGVGDAMNLGWKLAATVRQESKNPLDTSLIDTYQEERYPIGEWLLEWTRAQVAIMQPNPFSRAIRKVVKDLVATPDGANWIIDNIWGLSQRYPPGEDNAQAHPLVGCSAPDFEFADGSKLGNKLQSGKGLFIDFEARNELKEQINLAKYNEQVEYVGSTAKEQCDLRAVLVRPDGIVAWASEDEKADVDAIAVALGKWFIA